MEKKECCHTAKTKLRADAEKKALVNRLKRIEGQIRGIIGYTDAVRSGKLCNIGIFSRAAFESYKQLRCK